MFTIFCCCMKIAGVKLFLLTFYCSGAIMNLIPQFWFVWPVKYLEEGVPVIPGALSCGNGPGGILS